MTKKFGKVQYVNGRNIVINLDEPFDEYMLNKFGNGHDPTVELNIQDGREITTKQRRKVYGMVRDVGLWAGYNGNEAKEWLKFYYMAETGHDYFSLSNTSEHNAAHFIDYIVTFCFKWGIPFKKKTYETIRNDYRFQRECVLERRCLIDGSNHADIDHIRPVGSGRNRRHIDNSKFPFTCLCRKHHTERHQIGFKSFSRKYHIRIVPIHLTHDEVKKLHIGG